MDTRKNSQVVTGLQTTSQRVVDKLCSHCLFPVVVTSLEQAVHNFLHGIIRLVTGLF